MFEYEIGGRKFTQKALVLGQVKQLVGVVRGMIVPRELNAVSLIMALGDKVPEALAIVLNEENVPLKKKNLKDVQDLLEENLSIEQTIEMIENFFDCTPITSISGALAGLAKKVEMVMTKGQQTQEISSTESVSPLPEETLQNEMTSSGDSQ